LGQHLVEILEHILQELALRARLHQRNENAVEVVAIAQEEDGENGNKEQYPNFLCCFGDANADALREVEEIVAVKGEKSLNARFGGFAPAMLFADAIDQLADLTGNLSAAGFFHQTRKSFTEASALTADSGTGEENEESKCGEQRDIDNGDGARAAANELLQARDSRINEVGEEDSKEEKKQRAARGVEKAEAQREEQSRK